MDLKISSILLISTVLVLGVTGDELDPLISSIFAQLDYGTKNIYYSSDPNITLVLGLSGSGKSTFTQFITGHGQLESNLELTWDGRKTGEYFINDTTNKIGSGGTLSHTRFPDYMIDSETNLSMYDCPGFSDTRNATYDITGAYFIKQVTNRAKALKFIFTVPLNHFKKGNPDSFVKLATHAVEMIQNITKFKESIALIVTMNDDNKFNLNLVTRMLNNTRNETFKNHTFPFIDILLTNYTSDNEPYYPRIGFMPTFFNRIGPLSVMQDIQDRRKELQRIIKNITYTPFDASDINTSVSSDSKLYIVNLISNACKQFKDQMTDTLKKVYQYYNNSVEDMRKKILCFTDVNCKYDVSQKDAESFRTMLENGYILLPKEVDKKTNFTEQKLIILDFFNEIRKISELNFVVNVEKNVLNQIDYLKVLPELINNYSLDKMDISDWITEYNHNRKLFFELKENFNLNVSNVINDISSINFNMMKELREYFNLTIKGSNKTKLVSTLIAGRDELKRIKQINDSNGRTCIKQIQNVFNNNFTITNVSEKIFKYNTYLDVLHTLKHKPIQMNCSGKIEEVISLLDDLCKQNKCDENNNSSKPGEDDSNVLDVIQLLVIFVHIFIIILIFIFYNPLNFLSKKPSRNNEKIYLI